MIAVIYGHKLNIFHITTCNKQKQLITHKLDKISTTNTANWFHQPWTGLEV